MFYICQKNLNTCYENVKKLLRIRDYHFFISLSENFKMKKLKVRQANICRVVFIITFLISCTRPVQLPGEPTAKQTISKKSSTLNFCYKPDTPSSDLFTCVGHQMLEKLQDLEEKEEFNLAEGVIMKRDESGPRDISNYLDKDPMDFRYISKSY